MSVGERAPLGIIVAMTASRVIGKDGGLPWRLPEDLKHFKATTLRHAIVMGRKTYDSIGRPLPGRTNLVVSRQSGLAIDGCSVFPSLEEALVHARTIDREPIVIGGAALYALALPVATRVHLTLVARDVAGDTYFPAFDPAEWTVVAERPGDGVLFRELARTSHD